MNPTSAGIWLLVLTLSGLMDFLSLRWQGSAVRGRAVQATFWAVCVEVCGLTTVSYALDSVIFASAAVLGSAIGTYVSVRLQSGSSADPGA
jgi:hypothetical protein